MEIRITMRVRTGVWPFRRDAIRTYQGDGGTVWRDVETGETADGDVIGRLMRAWWLHRHRSVGHALRVPGVVGIERVEDG